MCDAKISLMKLELCATDVKQVVRVMCELQELTIVCEAHWGIIVCICIWLSPFLIILQNLFAAKFSLLFRVEYKNMIGSNWRPINATDGMSLSMIFIFCKIYEVSQTKTFVSLELSKKSEKEKPRNSWTQDLFDPEDGWFVWITPVVPLHH